VVEIEIGVLRGQCLDRRIGTRQRLESEIAAWERLRNAARSRIKWMFTIEKARTKMGRTYPCHADTRPKSKSHNHCAGILVEHNSGFVAKYIGDGLLQGGAHD